MTKRLRASFLLFLILFISVLIVILPSIFTKGVSRIELKQNVDLELILDGSDDIELVFFGYSGCHTICAPRLQALAQWYVSLEEKEQKNITIKFLDLSVPQDKTLPDSFAKAFHEDFKGVFLNSNILKTYTKTFQVYFSSSLFDSTKIDHTAHLYLVKKDKQGKQLRFIYTAFPYDFKQMQLDIQELYHE